MKTVLEYTTGSRMFGLETPDSDTDILRVYIDPAMAIEPSSKSTVHFETLETNTEGVEVELATFMRAVRDRDLKYIEALQTPPDSIHPLFDITTLVEYANSLDFTGMYLREITRRYNKSWFREINPNVKNFNTDQGYDSKFAAHLVRVLIAARHYASTGKVMTDFSYYRHTILRVRSGEITKEEAFSMTTVMKEEAEGLLNARERNKDPEMPYLWYFQQALKMT